MNLSDHFAPAEIAQLQAELEAAEERRYRRKAWLRIACALAAFWIVIGAVVWMVWL